MNKRLRMGIALALLAFAGQAAALGLGRIEVKSRLGEPLLAEIPVISSDPTELQQLQARLASPETFRRVGLQPPSGAAADLQFSLASDARGRPVIRVTTLQPVSQAQLDFLVEVDWGQGRLVREYAAVVAPANTATAAVQPAIRAPQVAQPDTVVRAPQPVRAPPAVPVPEPPVAEPPAPPASAAQVAVAPLPVPARPEAAPAPEASAAVVPVPEAAAAETTRSYGPVKRGDTLARIAERVGLAAGNSLEQAMLGLLRANPEAFIDENINLIRRGAVLRVPQGSEVAAIPREDATAVVREQMARWRELARPVPQPIAEPAPQPSTPVASAPVVAAATPPATRGAGARPLQAAPAPAPRPVQQARLEIVPPGEGGATATRSGASAGGEGRMLQQQLQQRDEEIAARRAEVVELKERVAELEDLQRQQQSLLAMKDTELAAAQQRLAQSNAAAAAPVATTQQAAATEPATQSRSAMPWIWGGLGLLGLALLAWLFASRRGRPVDRGPAPRRFDSAALASAAPPADDALTPAPVAVEPDIAYEPESAAAPEPKAAPPVPAWHSPRAVVTTVTRGPQPHAPAVVPPVDRDADAMFAEAPGIESAVDVALPPRPVVSPQHQLQLARAYVDLGDTASARDLLRSVLQGGDADAREQAHRLLGELD